MPERSIHGAYYLITQLGSVDNIRYTCTHAIVRLRLIVSLLSTPQQETDSREIRTTYRLFNIPVGILAEVASTMSSLCCRVPEVRASERGERSNEL